MLCFSVSELIYSLLIFNISYLENLLFLNRYSSEWCLYGTKRTHSLYQKGNYRFLYLLPWIYSAGTKKNTQGDITRYFKIPRRNILRLYWNNTQRNSNGSRCLNRWFAITTERLPILLNIPYIVAYNLLAILFTPWLLFESELYYTI